MSILLPCLLGASAVYVAAAIASGKMHKNNPQMKQFYGLQSDEQLDRSWHSGCVWMREISRQESIFTKIGTLVLLPLGGSLVSGFDTFVVSRTDQGCFVLTDKSPDQRPPIRFRAQDLQAFQVVSDGVGRAACGLLQFEPCDEVKFQLGNTPYWVQLPRSLREALNSHGSH